MVELGDQSEDLARVAFSGDVFSAILNLLPDREHLKLSKVVDTYGKYTKERMENILEVLEDKRADANILDKERVKHWNEGAVSGSGTGVKTHHGQQVLPPVANPIGYQRQLAPAPNTDCRICKHLETKGSQANLFQDHWGKFLHECPNFVAMTQEERVAACKATSTCLICLGSSRIKPYNCKRKKRIEQGLKVNYGCQVSGCFDSIWTCVRHKKDPTNTASIKKRKDDMSQRGWIVGMVAITPTIVAHTPMSGQLDNFNSVQTDTEESRFEELEQTSVQTWQHTPTTVQLDSFNSIQTQSEDSRIEELVSNAEKDGTRVIAEPRGKPIFKFFAAWGKVHPVTTFFDDGCSDCVMREGVPGIEWEGIITKKGPFNKR